MENQMDNYRFKTKQACPSQLGSTHSRTLFTKQLGKKKTTRKIQ